MTEAVNKALGKVNSRKIVSEIEGNGRYILTNKKKPWFTQEIKDLAEKKKKAYLKYISIRGDELKSTYIETKKTNQYEQIRQIKTNTKEKNKKK